MKKAFPGGFHADRFLLLVLISCAGIGEQHAQAPAASANQPREMPAPALPYYDPGACPFEGCVYREWTARKTLVVYDTYEARRKAIGRVSAGEKVAALTGVVITFRPGVVRMNRDLPEQGLRRGDTVLTYTYQGEGVSSVWVKGRFYPAMDLAFARGPGNTGCQGEACAGTFAERGRHAWWARIRTKLGVTGWVVAEGNFDGQDLLA